MDVCPSNRVTVAVRGLPKGGMELNQIKKLEVPCKTEVVSTACTGEPNGLVVVTFTVLTTVWQASEAVTL